MLKFPPLISILLYNGVFLALAVVVYMFSSTFVKPVEQLRLPFFIAFCSVYLAGMTSLTTIYLVRKLRRNPHDIIAVLAGTLVRTTVVGSTIILMIVTQEKKVAFFMLCFSIVFYLCLIPLNVWLTTLPVDKAKSVRNHHETR